MDSKLQVDVFYSFRSPYSYLASPRLADIAKTYNVTLTLRPVFPLIVRTPDWFVKSNPLLPKYIGATDCPRIAECLNIPYQWPKPDPVRTTKDENGNSIMAEEQPHIYRLTYLGIVAQEMGRGIQFAYEVSRVIWTTNGWNRGSHLADAVRRAGLDLKEMDEVVRRDEKKYNAIAAENLRALEVAGHWGVPTCVFRGEPFFGQDRLDLLLWRLRQNGLMERAKLA